MKRIVAIALVLSLLLCVAFSVPAQASTSVQKYSITVKFSTVSLVSNKSVGNSWSHVVTAMGKSLTVGKSYKLVKKSTDSISIICTSTEKDKVPDIGKVSFSVKVSALKTGTTTYTKTVTVTENRGRYTGNKAVWKYIVTVTKAKA